MFYSQHRFRMFLLLILMLAGGKLTSNEGNIAQRDSMYHPITCLKNCRVVRDQHISKDDLWLSGGKIVPEQQKAELEIDMQGQLVAPGYIDLQINGAFGVDFTREPERVEEVAKKLTQFGVTSFVPTLVSSSEESYHKSIPAMKPRKVPHGAEILGIHLEGPYLNPDKVGAHQSELLRTPPKSFEEVEKLYGTFKGVRLVTLAPELPHAKALIEGLEARSIITSAGHTDATGAQMLEGMRAGITLTTHLFNAMRPLHHREPGVVGESLLNSKHSYSIIADGAHLHKHTVCLAYRANPNGCILVSDGMSAMGLAPGIYTLGDQKIQVDVLTARLAGEKTLAGSICPLDRAVRHLREATDCSVEDALDTVTRHPAKLLRVDHVKGNLEVGADADLVVLDEELNVKATMVAGEVVWGAL